MIDLSLCMITKNEENNIERCLRSAEGLVNEILMLDTGSTDKTVEIATSLNANILPYNLKSFDFASARNESIKYAWGRWILILDADDELPNESRELIREIIQTDEKAAYKCSIISKMPTGEKETISSIRLFKNERGLKFYGKAHEQVYPSLVTLEYKLIESKITIIHHGYDVSEKIIKSKLIRNTNLLLSEYAKKQHWLTAYQIAQSYDALKWYKLRDKYYDIYLKEAPEEHKKVS